MSQTIAAPRAVKPTPAHHLPPIGGNTDPSRPLPIHRAAEVVSAVASWFTNQRNADDVWTLTHFHSAVVPGVSLADYATTLNQAVAFGDDGMEIALILIGRACQPHVEPALNLSALSMHRLLLTALRVATKAHHDVFRSNKKFARAGGVPLAELNMLEVMFLDRIEFNVQVTAEEVARLRDGLRAAAVSVFTFAPVVMVKHFTAALNLWPFADPRPPAAAGASIIRCTMREVYSMDSPQRNLFPGGGVVAGAMHFSGVPSRVATPNLWRGATISPSP